MKRGINVEKNSEKEKIDFEKIQKDIRKYILDEINKKYKKNEEKVLCELLNAMGYETSVERKNEEGKNIIATKPGTSLTILLQFNENAFKQDEENDKKDDDENDEEEAIFKMDNNYDVLVTLSNYGEGNNEYTKKLRVNKALGGKEIVEMVLKYYSQMSDEFKKNIPLKMMLIPCEWDVKKKDSILFD